MRLTIYSLPQTLRHIPTTRERPPLAWLVDQRCNYVFSERVLNLKRNQLQTKVSSN